MEITKSNNPQISEFLFRKATKMNVPLSGTFELTPTCNMKCKMCYVTKSKKEVDDLGGLKTAEHWIQLGEVVRDAGTLFILITGGEPFVYPEIKKVLTGLSDLGLVVSVNTNGTLINEEVISWLKNVPPVKFNITLYGSSNEVYEKLCGNPQGFDQASRAIDLLLENGFHVGINISLTPENKDDYSNLIDFARNRNIPYKIASYMFPALRKDEAQIGDNHRLPPEIAAKYSALINKYEFGEEEYRNSVLHLHQIPNLTDTVDECLEATSSDNGVPIRCRAGRASYWITWQGDLTMCGMIPFKNNPNVFNIDFSKAWEALVNRVSKIRLPGKCQECSLVEWCKPCAAIVYNETGSFSKVPEYRCRMAHAFPMKSVEVAKELKSK